MFNADGADTDEVLSVDRRSDEDQTVISVRGEIDASTAPRLRDALQPLFGGTSRVVLDLQAVDFIDSSGLRVILDAHKGCDGRLWLRGLSPATERLLDITGLRRHLQVLN
jgi:anti-anti-sigma factor